MEAAYQFTMTREQIEDLVANICDTYEAHLGSSQSVEEALQLTQDATIASLDSMAAKWAENESFGAIKH